MSPEELDEARAEEAYRQWQEEGCQGDDTIDVAAIAARLAREDSEARIKELKDRVAELEGALLGMTAAARNRLPDSAKQHNLKMALKVLKDPSQ